MNLLKYFILFANIVSGLTLIPYASGAMYMAAVMGQSTNEFLILLILSIYPLGIFATIYYSRKFHQNNRNILACIIAYIPALIALETLFERFKNLGHL